MSNRLTFKGPDLERLLVWARNNDAVHPYTHKPVEDKEYPGDEQGLWLVKDDGIYLMSASNSDGKGLKKADGKPVVTYASGYDPKYEDDIWEKTYAVSPDDFAEFIPLGQLLEEWTDQLELRYLAVTLEEEALEVAWMFKEKNDE
ncbi:MAG: hypothetical protein CMQ41_05455 [Gammaproteobacteria bacterium]|nr:hypothetical protein [Gammaproteobacteria bacterium]|tara:strand:- start:79 stop:513 length:435 start_codon:yes stop_codon:yes gene_type:complete